MLVEQNVKAALAIADRAVILVEGQLRHEGTAGDPRRRPDRRRALSRRAPRSRDGAAMNPQVLMDGLIAGAMIGLGAIGVTLTYSILRFANFAHGELISWGAYFALAVSRRARLAVAGARRRRSARSPSAGRCRSRRSSPIALTGGLALLVDALLFGRLRAAAAPSSSW